METRSAQQLAQEWSASPDVRRARRFGILVAALGLFGAGPASAEDVRLAFTATVTQVVSSGPLPEGYPSVGEKLSGRIAYDPLRPGKLSGTRGSYRFRPPGHGVDLDLPSEPRFIQGDLLIVVSRGAEEGSPHHLQIGSEMRAAGMGWPFRVRQVRVVLFLTDESGSALDSLSLPSQIDLSAFDAAELRVIGAWPPDSSPTAPPAWSLAASLDTLEPFLGTLEGGSLEAE